MYDSYHNTLGAPLTLESAGYHNAPRKQAVRDMIGQLQAASAGVGRGDKSGIEAVQKDLFKVACDSRMLRSAWDELASRGERAPGPNGWRYGDFQEPDIWGLLKCLGDQMRCGEYQPGPVRQRAVPKDPHDASRGSRTITLLNIEDVVVQRSVLQVLQATLDPLFEGHAFGYRPGRDRVHALAHAKRLAEREDRFVWVVEDIKNAFDNIPRKSLLDAIRCNLPSPELMDLIQRIVLCNNQKRGTPQGAPLSSFFLNLYLHHIVIRRWRASKFSQVPILHVADDFLLLCRTENEARLAWEHLHKLLLEAGFSTKHGIDKATHDLRFGKPADWLGYEVQHGINGLEAKIADRCWNRLKSQLELAHTKPDSPLRANAIIGGWLDQLGPCFSFVNRNTAYNRIRKIATDRGFEEIASSAALRFRWLQAHLRWNSITSRGGSHAQEESLHDGFDEPEHGICVDAAWSPKTREMEYRGLWLNDNSVAFSVGPLETGSNNIGEFLAIVHALKFLKAKGMDCPVYSDSRTARVWVEKRQVASSPAANGDLTDLIYHRLTRALLWLSRYAPTSEIREWHKHWGEIPADYGRK